nr:DNA ligase D [Hyphomonas sp.]
MVKSKLATYRKKRNFTATSEPSGDHRVTAAEHPRFVIQKHAARNLHYDLRLEIGGVFKSWAITRGPSLDPADKRLAVEVENHPLDYGDFEGTIPKGEYGGGTVMIWDRGYWEPQPGDDPAQALEAGELKFTLAGEKLTGSFVLVRIRKDRRANKRKNWLLIKHRDGLERPGLPALTDDDRSVASARTMDQIAAGGGRAPTPFILSGKGAKAARAVKTPARKAPVAIPQFVTPQLCTSVAKAPDGSDWLHEIKYDGYRMQLRVVDGVATLRTRTGLDWTAKFPSIARPAAALSDALIDGEVVVFNAHGQPDFAALQAALSSGRTDLRPLALISRKDKLKTLLVRSNLAPNHIHFAEHFCAPGNAVFQSACRMSLEGIVSKRAHAAYSPGRTRTWVKTKCRIGQEVVIAGWSGRRTIRSLLAGVYEEGQLRYAGRVGTGYNAQNSTSLLKELKALATKKSPFAAGSGPNHDPDVTWVKPKLVAEINFAGWTGTGRVRQASFKGLRRDKPPKQVQREVASAAVTTPFKQGSVPVKTSRLSKTIILGTVISHPDKVLWPGTEAGPAMSKRDLAAYLAQVGPWMIEHVRGRPCSVLRAPDGIESDIFFQRHPMAGLSPLISEVTIAGSRQPYVKFDSVAALVAAAQSGAIEFHPWNCMPGEPDKPGRLVFDLDPGPDVPFEAVVDAAREIKARLEALGLISFCKTTGGKGLHVVTPISVARTKLRWPEAKTFAHTVCAQMASDSPAKYIVKKLSTTLKMMFLKMN